MEDDLMKDNLRKIFTKSCYNCKNMSGSDGRCKINNLLISSIYYLLDASMSFECVCDKWESE